MKSIDSLIQKAQEFKEKGLTEKEISNELHLSLNTVNWLLTRGVGEKPPADVKIGWRSIGVFGHRIGYTAAILADIIAEELGDIEKGLDTVIGIAINGIPLAGFISEELDKEFAIFRPSEPLDKGGTFSSNYAGVKGKKVVIVDDVIGTGETVSSTINALKENGATPVLVVAIVNKTEKNSLLGVPLRALIRARAIS